jgi:hypothetical protein
LQDLPDGGVVTFVQVAVVADEVQVSQDPVQERLPKFCQLPVGSHF